MPLLKNRTVRLFSAAAMMTCLGTVSAPSHASDPCETVLCLAGMAMGAGMASECSSAVSDYFSIVKFKHGRPSLSRTAKARESFLDGCAGADSDTLELVNSSFGRVLSL
ncbi:TrbM/KikA/MpfK family conjugal transfer protein [Kushneria indalinina]|uniref:TrbM protein n=1 Tax=Kushneria indalinina DSM 14324 TaxID=1122140 RepID=A0A3D9DRL0_9GAMM|nr:TrbM/KikA/MpfK family conjugal transfer protein [Kushneria indalinina]REC93332.1 TrbM protein [Kushneria indalinina DSM 14324]